MLPGFRLLLASVLLAASVLVFGLGAAALLRATHEEFAAPVLRNLQTPKSPVVAEAPSPPPTIALLRVDAPIVASGDSACETPTEAAQAGTTQSEASVSTPEQAPPSADQPRSSLPDPASDSVASSVPDTAPASAPVTARQSDSTPPEVPPMTIASLQPNALGPQREIRRNKLHKRTKLLHRRRAGLHRIVRRRVPPPPPPPPETTFFSLFYSNPQNQIYFQQPATPPNKPRS